MKVEIGPYPDDRSPDHEIHIDDYDLWSLDYTLALIILPCLKKLKKADVGYPVNLTPKEWHDILGKMIKAFTLITKDELESAENDKIKQEGLELFGKYYLHLWT